jgi:subtilisin family serine protease
MDSDTYLILRFTGRTTTSFDPLRPALRSAGTVAEVIAGVEFRIESPALNEQDYRELRRDPDVAYIARPMPVQLIAPVPSSASDAEPKPIDGTTWGVHVTGALQSPYVGHGVTIAVLDTGIDKAHEAFQSVELEEKDFTGEGNGDLNGHGTHVAGTIFGRSSGGVRYAVAPGIRRALIGKVIGTTRSATTKEIIDAIQWAVDGGARIINMSLGFDFPGLVKHWAERGLPVDLATSRALAQYRDNVRFFDATTALLRARAAQYNSALLVAAAGNESHREKGTDYTVEASPPAAADGMVAVAALRTVGAPHSTLRVAPFSNVRAAVAAPGVGVYSAQRGGGYTFLNGTSMASPHVTGIAALWAERQLKRNGMVNVGALDAQLRGNAGCERLHGAAYLDVGEGLVMAPRE